MRSSPYPGRRNGRNSPAQGGLPFTGGLPKFPAEDLHDRMAVGSTAVNHGGAAGISLGDIIGESGYAHRDAPSGPTAGRTAG